VDGQRGVSHFLFSGWFFHIFHFFHRSQLDATAGEIASANLSAGRKSFHLADDTQSFHAGFLISAKVKLNKLRAKLERKMHSWPRNSRRLSRHSTGEGGFFFRQFHKGKGLTTAHIRLVFSIGFGDAADVIQMDARSEYVRIVRRAESAKCTAEMLEGDTP
jgi:hypothetical protein